MRLLVASVIALLLAGTTLLAQERPPQEAEQKPAEETSTEKQDAQKERVRLAQQVLQAEGYYSGVLDGIAGPQTEAALREFQQVQGLEVTGKLDDETAERLGID